MRASPPHLLLTNYAMLEYLLIRPADIDLFDGPHAGTWRFIVMDEAHVYDGAQGSEVAMLLRRLKQRVAPKSNIQCIATSASLTGNIRNDPRAKPCSLRATYSTQRLSTSTVTAAVRTWCSPLARKHRSSDVAADGRTNPPLRFGFRR